MIYYFISFPLSSTLPYVPKSTRLRNIYISTWNSSLIEVNFSPSWRNTLESLLMDTIDDSPV